jgi:hypothetical protein
MSLDRVVDAWASLPEACRSTILLIVDAASMRSDDTTQSEGYLAATTIAELHGLNAWVLRRHLKSWRANNDDWIENANRASRDPRFLYRAHSIAPLVERLRGSTRPSKSPPKRI